jgi:hypothetical protein
MKSKAGLIFPVLILIFGAYALLTALGTVESRSRSLSGDPRLAMMFGLICLGAGVYHHLVLEENSRSRAVTKRPRCGSLKPIVLVFAVGLCSGRDALGLRVRVLLPSSVRLFSDGTQNPRPSLCRTPR